MASQMDDQTTRWFLFAFPFLFVGMWLFITSLLGAMSGWFTLQRRYPRGAEPPIRTFRMKSGSMGGFGLGGVAMNGILNLSPTRDGLRLGVFRLFGLFQRPFEVPWADIRVERRTRLFLPSARLTFGTDEGNLTLGIGLWNRVVACAPDRERARLAVEPVDARLLASSLAAIWVAATALFGTFIAMTSRANPDASPVPLAACYGMPAIVIGIALFSLWIRQIR